MKKDLVNILREYELNIPREHFQYQNPDYETQIYFYNNNFKGVYSEKTNMNNLLNKRVVLSFWENSYEYNDNIFKTDGFLEMLTKTRINEQLVTVINYNENDFSDISKAIYRMTSIGLVEDFTIDYKHSRFRIVSTRHEKGYYFKNYKNI